MSKNNTLSRRRRWLAEELAPSDSDEVHRIYASLSGTRMLVQARHRLAKETISLLETARRHSGRTGPSF